MSRDVLISSLLPHRQDHGDLEKNIITILETRGLQRPSSYVTKVIQLYDTMNVRFGVMLVGPTGGGKSECYRTLQGAVTRLRSQMSHKDPAFQVCGFVCIFWPYLVANSMANFNDAS